MVPVFLESLAIPRDGKPSREQAMICPMADLSLVLFLTPVLKVYDLDILWEGLTGVYYVLVEESSIVVLSDLSPI